MSPDKKDLTWLLARPIAHRGYHDMNMEVWENSPSAFQRAIDKNFAIECDIHIASDGVPVVFHDFDLLRVCGIHGDVRERTSAELALLSIGGTADRIPSLPALLRQVDGRVPLLIELKGRDHDDAGFADAVIECLEGYGGPVALMSFNLGLLRDLKGADCPVPVGLTGEGTRKADFDIQQKEMKLGLDFISYCVHHLPNPFITEERARGVPILTWTVREPQTRKMTMLYADQMTFEGFDPDTTPPPA